MVGGVSNDLWTAYDYEREQFDRQSRCVNCEAITQVPEGVAAPRCGLCGELIFVQSDPEDWRGSQ